MSGLKKEKVRVPNPRLHPTENGFIVEVGKPFAGIVRCEFFSIAGRAPLGWTTTDSSHGSYLFWPCSSPFNFSYAVALRVVRANNSVPHWKVPFIANMFATRLAKLVRPTVAGMDAAGLVACSQITKHIGMLDWKTRCYGKSSGLAIYAHLDRGIPLRPSLVLSHDMSICDDGPAWSFGSKCAEYDPLDALEYQYGDVGAVIYDSLVKSRKQLRTVDMSSRLINSWGFKSLPKRQQDIETLAMAFVNGMHACQCCIGSDVEAFVRQVGDLVRKTPRKGRRSSLFHADVCINNCKMDNCEKVEDEAIL